MASLGNEKGVGCKKPTPNNNFKIVFSLHIAHRFAEKSMILIDAIFHHRSPL